MEMQKEEEHTTGSTSIGTVTQVSLEVVEEEERNQKVVISIKQNTKHAARATQVERQVEKTAYKGQSLGGFPGTILMILVEEKTSKTSRQFDG